MRPMSRAALVISAVGLANLFMFAAPAAAQQQTLALLCQSNNIGSMTLYVDFAASTVSEQVAAPGAQAAGIEPPINASITPLAITWRDPARGNYSINRATGIMNYSTVNSFGNGVFSTTFTCTQTEIPQTRF